MRMRIRVPDPATYAALSTHWHCDTLVHPIRIGGPRTDSWEDFPLVRPYQTCFVDVTQTEREEIVDSLE